MKIQLADSVRAQTDVVIRCIGASEEVDFATVGPSPGDLRAVGSTGRTKKGPTVLEVSLGPEEKIGPEALRRAGGAAAKWARARKVRRAAVELGPLTSTGVDGGVEAFCEGLALGAFRFDRLKSTASKPVAITVDLVGGKRQPGLARRLAQMRHVADSVNATRAIAHEPANVINPLTLAAHARRLARRYGLKCKVYDDKQLAKMKAHALLAVGAASKTPSRLIVLEHAGSGGARAGKPVVLVGKAITFDTGGYSLKDKNGIVGMKYDKCGGMAVLGVMQAAAALKLRTPVIGVIPAAENMISGAGYRPNDIITTMSGKTVEIISTDAEGRLILADALTYVQKSYKPRAVIDLATLTGGVVVALGAVRAGLFSNDESLAEKLMAAGENVHERLWRLPMDDEYLELIAGDDSDIKNSGGRSAHPVTAAVFLKQFIDEKTCWAHLDIAGVGDSDKDLPYCPKGATGFGVRLLVDYLKGL